MGEPGRRSFQRISDSQVFSLPELTLIGEVVCLPPFHAAHRIRHGLKLGTEEPLNKRITYGSAALLSDPSL